MSDSDSEYSPFDLRDMDEEEARQTLTVNEFEQWEQIQELYDSVEETKAEFERDADAVAEVTVSADMEALGTEVDIFGNTLLVRANPEDRELIKKVERIEAEFGDIAVEDPDADGAAAYEGVPRERLNDMATALVDVLDHLILRWDGTDWASLSDAKRDAVLAQARETWQIDGLQLAWEHIVVAMDEERSEREDRLKSFRSAERRGSR